MSMRKNVEPLSDHPLFRALVLMGGGLAVGCGGVAQSEAPIGANVGSSGSPSDGATSIAAAGSVGGSTHSIDLPTAAGAPTQAVAGAAGAPNTDVAALYNPSCPYAQWDCGAISPGVTGCDLYLKSKDDPLAAGCKCNTSRPTSAAACQADEQFVCRQGYPPYVEAQPGPSTWDGSLHVQCACVPAPAPTRNNCNLTCAKVFGVSEVWTRCSLSNDSTCDAAGVCSATSADVLRQDGILCGCADIGLK